MLAPEGKILIKTDKNEKKTRTIAGVEIEIHGDWNNYAKDKNVPYGEVISVPPGCKEDIKVGDKIYTKHFLVDNVVSEGIHWADISLLYCTIREGKINMVNGWNLLEPIHVENKKDGIYTANYSSDDRNWAVVKHPSEFLLSTGIKEGDTVAFRDGCDYKFEFEGETLIRTRTVDIFGKLQEPVHGDI
jgi:co-chaperonin GroES (HSP10)